MNTIRHITPERAQQEITDAEKKAMRDILDDWLKDSDINPTVGQIARVFIRLHDSYLLQP